jgi:DNA invertase Pin-like site-specific DNA recombinase
MIYGYIRVSTDRQTTDNQRFGILKFCDEKRVQIDQWVEETISATKHLDDRKLGPLLARLQPEDVLIVTELSRLGRSSLEVMSILYRIMETEAKVFTTKERYELGNTISSKVLAFAFSLSAEIERSMISSRTKEALARKKSEGMRLGRPKGSYAKETKLTGNEAVIQSLLAKRVSHSAIARILGVHRGTLSAFVTRHHLEARQEL